MSKSATILSIWVLMMMAACGSSGKAFDFEKYEKEIEAYDPMEVDSHPEIIGGMSELMMGFSYPEEARKNGIEGRVLIGFVVDKNGDPYNFEVLESVGYGCDEELLRALSRVSFTPAMKDGEPVNVHFEAPFSFRLP